MNLQHTKNCRSVRTRWFSAAMLKDSHKIMGGIKPDRLIILKAVWPKEAGHLAAYWKLAAVKGDSIIIKTASPAAAQELYMRSPRLIKSLNNYFSRPWIKSVRSSVRG
ncbi:MAG: DciA family protein [bacterium]